MGRASDAAERLVATASDLMHERGYSAVGVGEICAGAGVNKGSFYHFFPSKSALGIAVVDRYWARAEAMLDVALAPDAPALDRLDRMCRAHHDECARALAEGRVALGCPFGTLALEVATQDETLRTHLVAMFKRMATRVADVVRDAVREGSIPDQDPFAAAHAILAVLEGRQLQSRVTASAAPLAALPTDIHRLLSTEKGTVPFS